VAQMRWSEIDGDVWVIPRERYKNGKANAVPLSEPVQRILGSIPRTSEYVFTTTGRSPISGFSKAKAAMDRASGVTGWRLHDLRRTARSLMSRAGCEQRHCRAGARARDHGRGRRVRPPQLCAGKARGNASSRNTGSYDRGKSS